MGRPSASPFPARPPSRRTPWLTRVLIVLLVAACNGADSVTITNGSLGSVHVTVTDNQNQGVPGIGLTLSRTGQNPRSGTSGSDGTHLFSGVAAGSWTLAAERGGAFDLAPGELVQRPVSVPANGTAMQRIRVVAGGLRGVIAGHVTHGGAGVGSVQVNLSGVGGRHLRSTTATDGAFRFEGLEAGNWVMEVAPPSYFTLAAGEQEARTVAVGAGGTVTVRIGLARPGGPTTSVISLLMDSYDPSEVTVSPGTRIRWVNVYSKAHTISPGGHWAWRLVELSGAGEQFETVLNNPGTYPYLCEYLYTNGMTGTITVAP